MVTGHWVEVLQSLEHIFCLNNLGTVKSGFLMTRRISKLLIPNLQSDQRRKRMNVLIIMVLVILSGGGVVGAAIFFLNKR
jgi:hypothetical protein